MTHWRQGTHCATPMVGAPIGFHRHQRTLSIGKESRETITLELESLNFASFRINHVQLTSVLGNVHSNDRQLCGSLHGGASNASGYDKSPLLHNDAIFARCRHSLAISRTQRPVTGETSIPSTELAWRLSDRLPASADWPGMDSLVVSSFVSQRKAVTVAPVGPSLDQRR